MLCRAFVNLFKNAIEGMKKKLEIFWRDVNHLFGELMVKGAKSRDSLNEIQSQKLIMN